MPSVNHTKLRAQLLRWFAKHQREMPWRKNGSPYRIFVVEVMLQQTQIKTVIPYYDRWLKAFPTVESLARAPIDRVLKLWEGLGYYSRARNLHKAAQRIVQEMNGKIPSDPEELQKLPGIGKYTAGAIASIAFGKAVPLVDGNVARVFSRIFNVKKDILKPETQAHFYEIAQGLVPKKNPGIFNQALMELGSLVCIPETPKCSICPVSQLCVANLKGDPTQLPMKSKGVQVKKMEMVVGFLKRDGKILIRKRPDRGIWGGLWEIPSAVRSKAETREEALTQEFKESLGIGIEIKKPHAALEHRFTHRIAKLYPFDLTLKNSARVKKSAGAFKWALPRDLKKYSFPVPHQKLLISAGM